MFVLDVICHIRPDISEDWEPDWSKTVEDFYSTEIDNFLRDSN